MPGGDYGIRADQGHAASRNIKTQVLVEVHMHDRAYRGRDGIADVSWWADAAYVFPVRRGGAEPEWIVFRLSVARIALEWITIGKGRGVLDAGVPLSPAVLVELNAAGSRAISNVADGHRATQGIDVDGARPEIGAVGGGECIGVIAQIHFQAVSRRKTRSGKMENQEFGSPRSRRGRWIKA